ncbi:PE-PPE domain-containing protein [Mycobacterium sp. M26]|uniref:PE-PPE domain-containing protein n=1 Tax=Mycobacterium sp. M26 TaxID=1762962 RepID=UPI001E2CD7E1|nr:PE-PPE domain-containing protein [Mycobacterium sp. M26]
MASALLGAVVLGAGSMGSAVVTPMAWGTTSALIMGGTGHSLATPPDTVSYVEQFISATVDNYIAPSSTVSPSTGIPQGPYNGVAVITPEEASPTYGSLTVDESVALGLAALHSCLTSTVCDYNQDVGSAAPSPSDSLVVFGYSQSAVIAMLEKAQLAAEYAAGEGPAVSFVVVGDTKRPNGGLYARDPNGMFVPAVLGGGSTFGGAAPTDTQYSTVDVALQYDGLADFPVNPLNLLAVVNAYVGMSLIHSTYGEHSLTEQGIVDQGQYGDTHYYLIPTPVLPLLMPLQQVPLVGSVLADMLDAPLRVLVEAGYDRTTSPGQPTPFNLLYFPNPLKTTLDFLVAIPTGLDNGFEDVFGVRPFGTQRPGPYGVGGPDSDCDSADTAATSPTATSTTVTSRGNPAAAGRTGRSATTPKGDVAEPDSITISKVVPPSRLSNRRTRSGSSSASSSASNASDSGGSGSSTGRSAR